MSVALDSLKASNWTTFMREVDRSMQELKTKIAKAVQSYWSASGGILGTLEKQV